MLVPTAVKDNGQGGYYQYGKWTTMAGGYDGTYAVANPKTSSNASAFWTMTVAAGTYNIWATWVGAFNQCVERRVYDLSRILESGHGQVDQQQAPVEGEYGGVLWSQLGTYTVTKGTITVALSAKGADGDIVADGILLVPAEHVHGGDAPVASVPKNTPASAHGPARTARVGNPPSTRINRSAPSTGIGVSSGPLPLSDSGGTMPPRPRSRPTADVRHDEERARGR